MGCEQNIQSADDVVAVVHDELSKPSIKDWVGSGTRLRVEKVDCTRDWRGHLPSLGIKLEGGLLRDDTGNHFFLSMMRRGSSIIICKTSTWMYLYQYTTVYHLDVNIYIHNVLFEVDLNEPLK